MKPHTTRTREDVAVTEGKEVVLVVRQADERQAITTLLEDIGMVVHHAETGREAIIMLEEHLYDFLLMDVQLADMHGWRMLGILRESVDLSNLPTIAIMDDQAVVPIESVTSVVRPVSMAKLRNIIYNLFSRS